LRSGYGRLHHVGDIGTIEPHVLVVGPSCRLGEGGIAVVDVVRERARVHDAVERPPSGVSAVVVSRSAQSLVFPDNPWYVGPRNTTPSLSVRNVSAGGSNPAVAFSDCPKPSPWMKIPRGCGRPPAAVR
jgi:hypothetical protein